MTSVISKKYAESRIFNTTPLSYPQRKYYQLSSKDLSNSMNNSYSTRQRLKPINSQSTELPAHTEYPVYNLFKFASLKI